MAGRGVRVRLGYPILIRLRRRPARGRSGWRRSGRARAWPACRTGRSRCRSAAGCARSSAPRAWAPRSRALPAAAGPAAQRAARPAAAARRARPRTAAARGRTRRRPRATRWRRRCCCTRWPSCACWSGAVPLRHCPPRQRERAPRLHSQAAARLLDRRGARSADGPQRCPFVSHACELNMAVEAVL